MAAASSSFLALALFAAAASPSPAVSGSVLLSVPDPAGDAHGDGSYQLPVRPAFSSDQLDLRLFTASAVNGKLRLSVSFGSIGNPWNAPSGFSGAVLDIFIKTGPGGQRSLTNLGLSVPGASGWQQHYRVTGFGVQQFSADQAGNITPSAAKPRVHLEGTSLVLDTDMRAGEYSYWVTSSAYTPLSQSGLLKPGGDTGSLGLRSASAASPTPLDVLLSGDQKAVYATRILPPVGRVQDTRALVLLGTAFFGLLVAVIAGIAVWRRGP